MFCRFSIGEASSLRFQGKSESPLHLKSTSNLNFSLMIWFPPPINISTCSLFTPLASSTYVPTSGSNNRNWLMPISCYYWSCYYWSLVDLLSLVYWSNLSWRYWIWSLASLSIWHRRCKATAYGTSALTHSPSAKTTSAHSDRLTTLVLPWLTLLILLR